MTPPDQLGNPIADIDSFLKRPPSLPPVVNDPNEAELDDPNVTDFLGRIRKSEGAGYNTLVGGREIADLSKHPNIVGLRTAAGPSTAFGGYQITHTTNDGKLAKYADRDYSPRNQDLRAIELLRQTRALDAIKAGDTATAMRRAGHEWASIPGSSLPGAKRHDVWQDVAGAALGKDPSDPIGDIDSFLGVQTPNQQPQTTGVTGDVAELADIGKQTRATSNLRADPVTKVRHVTSKYLQMADQLSAQANADRADIRPDQATTAAPEAGGKALTLNDAAWHLGMTPQDWQRLTPRQRRKASDVLNEAVIEDDRKRAAGEPINKPTLGYQNEMRKQAKLPPLVFGGRPAAQIGSATFATSDPNRPEAQAPYYQPTPGSLDGSFPLERLRRQDRAFTAAKQSLPTFTRAPDPVRDAIRAEVIKDAPGPAVHGREYDPQFDKGVDEPAAIEQEVENRYQQYQRSVTPEMIAERKDWGTQPAALRAILQPAARTGAGIVHTLAGLSSLAGIAPNRVSDYLHKRAQFLEEGTYNTPLTAEGQEIARGLPEKAVGAVTELGFSVAEIVALKKATGMPLGRLMAVESMLKTSDQPLSERAAKVSEAYAMGNVLDTELSRPLSALLFGGPTAAQSALAVSRGKMSVEDALLQTGVQTAAGAILGGGGLRELSGNIIASEKAPEWLREVAAKATRRTPAVVFNETGDRAASVYVDLRTGEQIIRELSPDDAQALLDRRNRPSKIVADDEFERAISRPTPSAQTSAASEPTGTAPINRQIAEAGRPPSESAAPDEPPAAPPTPTTPRVPQASPAIEADMDALVNGRVGAVMVTPGSPMPEIPQGFKASETAQGTVIYPSSMTRRQIRKAIDSGDLYKLLGHVNPESQDATVAVVARSSVAKGNVKPGDELGASYVVPGNEEAAKAALLAKHAPYAPTIEVGGQPTVDRVMRDRVDSTQNEFDSLYPPVKPAAEQSPVQDRSPGDSALSGSQSDSGIGINESDSSTIVPRDSRTKAQGRTLDKEGTTSKGGPVGEVSGRAVEGEARRLTPRQKRLAQRDTKEPWQMTRGQVVLESAKEALPIASKVEIVNQKPVYTYSSHGVTITSRGPLNGVQAAERLHAMVVKKALAEGKPVPSEVLADYPDLAARKAVEDYIDSPPSIAELEHLGFSEEEARTHLAKADVRSKSAAVEASIEDLHPAELAPRAPAGTSEGGRFVPSAVKAFDEYAAKVGAGASKSERRKLRELQSKAQDELFTALDFVKVPIGGGWGNYVGEGDGLHIKALTADEVQEIWSKHREQAAEERLGGDYAGSRGVRERETEKVHVAEAPHDRGQVGARGTGVETSEPADVQQQRDAAAEAETSGEGEPLEPSDAAPTALGEKLTDWRRRLSSIRQTRDVAGLQAVVDEMVAYRNENGLSPRLSRTLAEYRSLLTAVKSISPEQEEAALTAAFAQEFESMLESNVPSEDDLNAAFAGEFGAMSAATPEVIARDTPRTRRQKRLASATAISSYKQQKAALTKALNISDPNARKAAVLAATTKTVNEWEQTGPWPDEWSRWQRAIDDVHKYGEARPTLEDLIGKSSFDVGRPDAQIEAPKQTPRQKRKAKAGLLGTGPPPGGWTDADRVPDKHRKPTTAAPATIGGTGPSLIQFPSGKWGFVGSVPQDLSYLQTSGEPVTEEQAHNIQQFGKGLVKDVVSRVWDTPEAALAEAEAQGVEVQRPSSVKKADNSLDSISDALAEFFPSSTDTPSGAKFSMAASEFNEELYAKVKPLLMTALEMYRGQPPIQALKSLMHDLVDKKGWKMDQLGAMQPYVVRVVRDFAKTPQKAENIRKESDANQADIIDNGRAGDGGVRAGDVSGTEELEPASAGVRRPSGGRAGSPRRTDAGSDEQSIGVGQRSDVADSESHNVEPPSRGDSDLAGNGIRYPSDAEHERELGNKRDYVAEPGSLTRQGSWKETARTNLDILELVKRLEAEDRLATLEEQALLVRFTGWGATEIANNLFPGTNWGTPGNRSIQPRYAKQGWEELAQRAADLFTPEELDTALASTQFAHYTSEAIIRGIWSALDQFGFKSGSILEPGMGVGLFATAAPRSVMQKSRYTGIERDKLTASIAKQVLQRQAVLEADFVKQKLPKNFFDIAVGNPPFARTVILDDPNYKKHRFLLHDYFFAKSIDSVRPGGLLVFVTSHGTMDKGDDAMRKYIDERADLLGAIRLPQTAFKQNAGTEVVTDVLFLRKRLKDEPRAGEPWIGRADVTGPTKAHGDKTAPISEYFSAHPEMVLGKHAFTGTMRGADEYTVEPLAGRDIEEQFTEAIKNLPTGVYQNLAKTDETVKAVSERDWNPDSKKEGSLYVDKHGIIRRVENGSGVVLSEVAPTSYAGDRWLKSYVELRNALKQAQHDQLHDGDWETSLTELNKQYDAFVKKHGQISQYTQSERSFVDDAGIETTRVYRRFKNQKHLKLDVESPLVLALEKITEDGKIEKGAMLLRRTIKPPSEVVIRSLSDALAVSLDKLGTLNLSHIQELMQPVQKMSRDDIIAELGESIFEEPGGNWQMADEYLSGFVIDKLEVAESAAKLDPRFERNVKALEKVQPKPLDAANISTALGATWIPQEVYSAFAREELGFPRDSITFDPLQNKYGVYGAQGSGSRGKRSASEKWGTADRSPNELLDAALNGHSIKIYRELEKGKKELDETASAAANDVVKKMKDAFRGWLWTDPERTQTLVARYNRLRNNIAPRRFTGEHLTLPGLSAVYRLHPHQLRVVWRIIQSGNTYLAHAVGAGKTLEMIVSAMEQRRLGLIKKPMFAVPKHMLNQFASEFLEAYPMANILVADEENFAKENRRRFVAQAALNDLDAIIITHSAFGLIRTTQETADVVVNELVSQLVAAIGELDENDRSQMRTIKELEARIEAITRKFQSKAGNEARDDVINFEDLGVDMLYVDEAHEFRKLDFVTNREKIKGIDTQGSQKALDLLIKSRWLDSQRPGRSMILASGTPITNTLAELYSIQRFMDPAELERSELSHFDAWSAEFGEISPEYEMNAAGKYELVERFSKFINIPELMKRVRQFMDVLTMKELSTLIDVPTIKGGAPEVVVVPATEETLKYLKEDLDARIEASRKWKPSFSEPHNPDPLINIITDGRLSAADMRYVSRGARNDPGSKLNVVIDAVIERYHRDKNLVFYTTSGEGEHKVRTEDKIKGAAQIIFSYAGFGEMVAKNRGFDAKGWVVKRLVEGGIPANEIAFMSDYKSDASKQNLFKEMRLGTKRLLFGSPMNMGTGLNVQKRLKSSHFIVPPWYPAHVEQPDGRIVRQGNQNAEVEIRRYATKGTYDSTNWQMLARKARSIEQAMAGDDSQRTLEDITESSLYEMASALAAGDARAIQLAGLRRDVERLSRLENAHWREQGQLRGDRSQTERRLSSAQQSAEELAKGIDAVGGFVQADSFTATVAGQELKKRGEIGDALKVEWEKGIKKSKAEAIKTEKPVTSELNARIIGKFPLRLRVRALTTGISTDLDLLILESKGQGAWQSGGLTRSIAYNTDAREIEGLDAVGLATRIFNGLNNLHKEFSDTEREVAEYQRSLKQIDAKLGQPFPEESELYEKTAELNRLQQEMAATGDESKAPAPVAETEGEPGAVAASDDIDENSSAEEIASGIHRNADRLYADEITHDEHRAENARLWDLARRDDETHEEVRRLTVPKMGGGGPAPKMALAKEPITELDAQTPKMSVAGNRITINPAMGKIVSIAYERGVAGIEGVRLETKDELNSFRVKLLKASVKHSILKDYAEQLLYMATERFEKYGSVNIAIPERMQHEVGHEAFEGLVHPDDLDELGAGLSQPRGIPDKFSIAKDAREELLQRGYNDDLNTLAHEAIAFIFEGRAAQLGMTEDQAVAWLTKVIDAAVARGLIDPNDPDAAYEKVKEGSNEVQKAIRQALENTVHPEKNAAKIDRNSQGVQLVPKGRGTGPPRALAGRNETRRQRRLREERERAAESGNRDRSGQGLARQQAQGSVALEGRFALSDDPWDQLDPSELEERPADTFMAGIRKSIAEGEQRAANMPELIVEARRSKGKIVDDAIRDFHAETSRARFTALAETPRALTPEEVAEATVYKTYLNNEYKTAADALLTAQDNGDTAGEITARSRLAVLGEQQLIFRDMARGTAYEQGLAFGMRAALMRSDYTLAEVMIRAFEANARQAVPPEVERLLQQLTQQRDEAVEALKVYDEQAAQRALEAEMRRLAREEREERRGLQRRKTKDVLDDEFAKLSQQFARAASRLSANPFFDPTLHSLIVRMVKNRVQAGVTNGEQLVDSIYQVVRDHVEEGTPRELRDAISGYGNDAPQTPDELAMQLGKVKKSLRDLSAVEDGVKAGKSLVDSQEPKSPRQRRARQRIKGALRDEGIDYTRSLSPEEQQERTLRLMKGRLRTRIDELRAELAGEARPSGRANDRVAISDDELRNLKAERDQLQAAVDAMDDDTRGAGQRIRETKQRVTKARDASKSPRQKKALESISDDLDQAAKPEKNPEAAALKALKTRLKNRAAELQKKLDTKDFSKKAKSTAVALDDEGLRLQAEVARVTRKIEREIAHLERANRSTTKRALDYTVKLRRAVGLSSAFVIGKLTAFGATRIAMTTVEELYGAPLPYLPIIGRAAKLAPREGYLSLRAEAAALTEAFSKHMVEQSVKAFKEGRHDIDLLYGKKGHDYFEPEWIEFFGRLHMTLKTAAKMAEFKRGMIKRLESTARQGRDPTDRAEVALAAMGGYHDALRAILMQDAFLSTQFNNLMRSFEKAGYPGLAAIGRAEFFVTKVPPNYVLESLNVVAGRIPATIKLTKWLIYNGVRELPPEKGGRQATEKLADSIIRGFKKNGIGDVIMAIGIAVGLGLITSIEIGGYYQRGEKRKPTDVQPGHLRVNGWEFPVWAAHSPYLEPLQIGATGARAYVAAKQKDDGNYPLLVGGYKAGAGLMSEIPFFEEPARAATLLEGRPDSFTKYIGDTARGFVESPDLQRAARTFDPNKPTSVSDKIKQMTGFKTIDATKRATPTIAANLQSGIPGLRNKLPIRMAAQMGAERTTMTPGMREMERLEMSPRTARRFSNETAQSYHARVVAEGEAALQALEETIKQPWYKALQTKEEKRSELRRAISDARQDTRDKLGFEPPERQETPDVP